MSTKKRDAERPTAGAIRLIDSCILCEILSVPEKCNKEDHVKYCKAFDVFQNAGGRFVLPLATLIETGNHIAHAKRANGQEKRSAAMRLVNYVRATMDSKSPFLKSEIWNADVGAWLVNYPDNAMRGKGLGDVSIEVDCEIVKRTFGVTGLTVEVWTKDKHIGESEASK